MNKKLLINLEENIRFENIITLEKPMDNDTFVKGYGKDCCCLQKSQNLKSSAYIMVFNI